MTRPDDPTGANHRGDGAGRKQPAADVDRRVDESLSALAISPIEPPPMSDELASQLADLAPVRTRAPRLEWAAVLALSLLHAAAILGWIGLRRDLDQVPGAWLVAVGVLWLVSYLSITWLILVPQRRQVMPRWGRAAVLAAVAAALVIACGLFRPEDVAAAGASYALSSFSTWLEQGHGCLRVGLVVALVPVILTALATRRALPVGSRWVAAAIGAAGGALGGLTLHLHCSIGERFHVGLVHGGLVLLAATVTALAARVAVAAREPSRRRRGKRADPP